MAIAVRFGASATALIVGAGISAGTLQEPATGTSTFTISTEPATPYVGECYKWRIEGTGGHTITNPLMSSDSDLADIWVQVDVDESGASFTTGSTTENAEICYGRIGGHVWAADGAKTPTVTSWTHDGDTLTQDFPSVTPLDPDNETWDAWYAVDVNGSTAGMPAGATQITSEAAFRALDDNTSVGDKIRVSFRGGTTHTLATADTWTQDADVVYIDTFSTGKATIANHSGLFSPRSSSVAPRWIIRDIAFVGPYSPYTGAYNAADKLIPFDTSVYNTDCTMWRCTGTGCDAFFGGGGNNNDDRQYQPCIVDCEVRNWQDYGAMFSGSCRYVIIRGTKTIQAELAAHGDIKPGTDPDYGNHTPHRISRYHFVNISQSTSISTVGWSSGGAGFLEKGIQDAVRAYNNNNLVGSYMCIIKNFFQSRVFLDLGTASSSGNISEATQVLWVGNTMEYGHQASETWNPHCGGVIAYSNVIYRPNLHWNLDEPPLRILDVEYNTTDPGGFTTRRAWEEPGYVGFNTMVSDVSGSVQTPQAIGGVLEGVNASDSNRSPDYTVEHNLISGDNHTSGSDHDSTEFSRGDDFRPITSGTADISVSSGGRPPVDFSLTKRSSTTNAGAHDAAGADVSVSSPTHTGTAPTIGATAISGHINITDPGTGWNNITNEAACDVQWQLDGTNNPNTLEAYTRTYSDASSGDVTCLMGRTNRSGNRVTVTSNTVAV